MKRAIIFLFVIIGLPIQAYAQNLKWEQINFPASEIYFSIFKAPSGNIYTSTSNGNNEGGFFLSSDEGLSWSKISASGTYMSKLYTNDETNWVGVDNIVSMTYFLNVSRDGGKNWVPLPLQSQYVALARNNNLVIIENDEKKMYISRDFGVNCLVIDALSDIKFNHIKVGQDGRIWAATESMGVIVSDDNGETWSGMTPASPGAIALIAVSQTGRPFILASNGNSFFMNSSRSELNLVTSPFYSIDDVEDIYAFGDDKLIVLHKDKTYDFSPNGGAFWETTVDTGHIKNVYDFSCRGDILYAGTHYGIWKSGRLPASVNESVSEEVSATVLDDRLVIKAQAGSRAEIYDIIGNRPAIINMSSEYESISLEALPHGVYIVAVITGNERITRKIVY